MLNFQLGLPLDRMFARKAPGCLPGRLRVYSLSIFPAKPTKHAPCAAIASILSVTPRSVSGYLTDIDKRLKEERKQKIFDMWMACGTGDEIAAAAGITKETVSSQTDLCQNLEDLPNSDKLSGMTFF